MVYSLIPTFVKKFLHLTEDKDMAKISLMYITTFLIITIIHDKRIMSKSRPWWTIAVKAGFLHVASLCHPLISKYAGDVLNSVFRRRFSWLHQMFPVYSECTEVVLNYRRVFMTMAFVPVGVVGVLKWINKKLQKPID